MSAPCLSGLEGNAGDNWIGLSPETRTELDALLAGDDDRTAMAEVVFASQVGFFFGADWDWCQIRVLPLLEWAKSDRGAADLGRISTVGRFNDPLLAAGLLGQYLAAAEHNDALAEELHRRLYEHLAAVAMSANLILNGSGG